jgi:hypothetical protein
VLEKKKYLLGFQTSNPYDTAYQFITVYNIMWENVAEGAGSRRK